MAYAVRLQQFEGPLNLLLELIEEEKLDITKVALATVTESFLKYLEEHPDIPPEDLTDFLVVASRLLLIKSKMLLPFLVQQEEEEEQDLESQLKIFKLYLDASKDLDRMIAKKRFLYVHEKLPKVDIGFSPPLGFTADAMTELFAGVIARLTPIVTVPVKRIIEKNVSIHEKIRHIRDSLVKAQKLSFRELITTAESKTEIIVSFLALLELVKQRHITVDQDGRFADITISRLETTNQPSV
jgi:segregation and condensation protein A